MRVTFVIVVILSTGSFYRSYPKRIVWLEPTFSSIQLTRFNWAILCGISLGHNTPPPTTCYARSQLGLRRYLREVPVIPAQAIQSLDSATDQWCQCVLDVS